MDEKNMVLIISGYYRIMLNFFMMIFLLIFPSIRNIKFNDIRWK